eukprot:gene7319-11638_t
MLIQSSISIWTLYPNVPSLTSPSSFSSKRLSKIKVEYPIFTSHYSFHSIIRLFGNDEWTTYGPVEDMQENQLINLCTHSLDFIQKNYSQAWNSNRFCEEMFCSSNRNISFFEREIGDSFLYNSIFTFCHLCDNSLNQVDFINRVSNGTCPTSSRILKNFEKCFDSNSVNLKIIPYFDFNFGQNDDTWCLSIPKNKFFFRDDINNLVLLPFDLFFHCIFVACSPEIFQLVRKIKKKEHKCTLLTTFSLRNQLILNLLIATGFPIFMSVLDFFIFFASNYFVLYAYGLMISYLTLSFAYVQTITLWAHYVSRSSNLAKNTLTRKHQIIYIITISFIILYCIPFVPIVAFIGWETLDFKISIGIYFVLIFVITSFIAGFMMTFSLMMFRILSKIEKDSLEKAKYFVKLKFTKLSFALVFILVFTSISLLLFYFYWNGIVVNWTIHFMIPVLLYVCPALFVFILFLGITNWTLFKEFFLFAITCGKYQIEDEAIITIE